MGGRQHGHAYVRVVGERLAGTGDRAGHVRGHGVHGLGPVEDELRDLPPRVPPYDDVVPEPPLVRSLRHDTLPVNAG